MPGIKSKHLYATQQDQTLLYRSSQHQQPLSSTTADTSKAQPTSQSSTSMDMLCRRIEQMADMNTEKYRNEERHRGRSTVVSPTPWILPQGSSDVCKTSGQIASHSTFSVNICASDNHEQRVASPPRLEEEKQSKLTEKSDTLFLVSHRVDVWRRNIHQPK